jgi:hypothetical protein
MPEAAVRQASSPKLRGSRPRARCRRPMERPYGIDAGFRDPSGNQIRMVQAR